MSQDQLKNYNLKFQKIQKIQDKILAEHNPTKIRILKAKYLSYCENDVSLFAYINLKNKAGGPFKLYPYQDLIVNDESKRVIVAKGRKIGATEIISIKALHKAVFNKNWEIVVASKTQPMAQRIIDRVRLFLKTVPMTYKNVVGDTDNKLQIDIKHDDGKANSRIVSVVAGDSARGIDPDLLIVDEAAFIGEGPQKNADYIYREILAPSITYKNGQTYLISTPPKQPVGFFWESFNSEHWNKYHFPSKTCPMVSDEFLLQMKDQMTDAAFRREYLGEFFSDESTYFTQVEIEAAVDDEIILGQHSEQLEFIGVDWGETLSNSARVHVICENFRDPEKLNIKVTDIVEYPLRTDYEVIIRELQEIHKRKNGNIRILADAGIGRGQIAWMRSLQMPVEEYSFGGTKKGDLFTELKILFEKRRIKIPNNRQLINELTVYQSEYNRLTQKVKYHAPKEGRIADHVLDALALACFCAVRKGIRTTIDFVPHEGIKQLDLSEKTVICPACEKEGKDGYHQAKADRHYERILCPYHS